MNTILMDRSTLIGTTIFGVAPGSKIAGSDLGYADIPSYGLLTNGTAAYVREDEWPTIKAALDKRLVTR